MQIRRTLLVLAICLLPALAQAQTHVCDTTAPANPNVANPYKVQFCSDLRDVDGVAIDPSAIQVRLTIDGAALPLRALPAATGAPNASGASLFELTGLVSAKGNHAVTVALVTADGEAVGSPFAFFVRGKAPKPPARTAVSQ
jgi:hypothetical protein